MVRKGTLARYQEHSLQGSSDSGFFLGEFSLFIIPILCHMFFVFVFFFLKQLKQLVIID